MDKEAAFREAIEANGKRIRGICTRYIPDLITGGALVVYHSFGRYIADPSVAVAVYLVVMAAAVTIGFWSGIQIWRKEKGKILEQIRDMRRILYSQE